MAVSLFSPRAVQDLKRVIEVGFFHAKLLRLDSGFYSNPVHKKNAMWYSQLTKVKLDLAVIWPSQAHITARISAETPLQKGISEPETKVISHFPQKPTSPLMSEQGVSLNDRRCVDLVK